MRFSICIPNSHFRTSSFQRWTDQPKFTKMASFGVVSGFSWSLKFVPFDTSSYDFLLIFHGYCALVVFRFYVGIEYWWKVVNFSCPACIWRLCLVIPSEVHHRNGALDNKLSYTIPTCDRQTDGQTNRLNCYIRITLRTVVLCRANDKNTRKQIKWLTVGSTVNWYIVIVVTRKFLKLRQYQ